jgi:uncharacterized protein YoaH (UPF0181 family)
MFSSKRSALYCSEANTRNIHVFARLCPAADITGSPESQPQQAQQQPQQQPQQQQQLEQHREFLLGRCAQAAWYLINQDVVKAHALVQSSQQQQQQRPAVSAFNRIRQLMRRGFGSDDKVAAVAAALQSCSTEGVWSMQQAKHEPFYLKSLASLVGGCVLFWCSNHGSACSSATDLHLLCVTATLAHDSYWCQV